MILPPLAISIKIYSPYIIFPIFLIGLRLYERVILLKIYASYRIFGLPYCSLVAISLSIPIAALAADLTISNPAYFKRRCHSSQDTGFIDLVYLAIGISVR